MVLLLWALVCVATYLKASPSGKEEYLLVAAVGRTGHRQVASQRGRRKRRIGEQQLTEAQRLALIGLPAQEHLEELAAKYLTCQRQLWKDLPAVMSLLPEPTGQTCKLLADAFADRQRSGKPGELSAAELAIASKGIAKLSVAYARFSDEHSNPKSLDDQLAQIFVRARRDGEFIPWLHVYADSAESGTTARRGGYFLITQLIESGSQPPATLYLDDFSRGGRNQLQWLKFAAKARLRGLGRIVGLSDGFDSSAPGSDLHLSVLALLSEQQSKATAARVQRGMRGAVGRKVCTGKPPPHCKVVPLFDESGRPVRGSDNVQCNTYAVDPERAAVCVRIVEALGRGNSPFRLARTLNQENALGRQSWTFSRVVDIGTTGTLLGVIRYGRFKYLTDSETGKTKPIPKPRRDWVIRRDPALAVVTWKQLLAARRAVRDRQNRRKSKLKGRRSTRNLESPTTLLSGTLFCGCCGTELTLYRSGKYKTFFCKNGAQATQGCTMRTTKAAGILEKAVLEYVQATLLADDRAEELAAEATRLLADEAAKPAPDVQGLEATRTELTRKIQNLMALVENEGATDDVKVRLKALGQERQEVTLKLQECGHRRRLTALKVTPELVRRLLGDLRGLLEHDVDASAKLLRKVIGDVRITETLSVNRRNTTAWVMHFQPRMAEALQHVTAARGCRKGVPTDPSAARGVPENGAAETCPDHAAWEFLRRAIWTTDHEVAVVADHRTAKFRTLRSEIVQRLTDGEGMAAVAKSLSVSVGVVKDAWRVHHCQGDPDGVPPAGARVPSTVPPQERYCEEVARLIHQEGWDPKRIARHFGVHRVTIEKAHARWHRLHPDKPGDIPHEAVCSRIGKIAPDVRREILRLLGTESVTTVAAELGLAVEEVRWQQMSWARFNRRRGTPIPRRSGPREV